MHELVKELLECLTREAVPDDRLERCGLTLSLVVERHSNRKSPDSMYAELLPAPYLGIELAQPEYYELVEGLSQMLVHPNLTPKSQEALIFALGGTDERTLKSTLPSIIAFLAEPRDELLEKGALRCLKRMLSDYDGPRLGSAQARSSLALIQKVRRAVELSIRDQIEKRDAISTLERLSELLSLEGT